MMDGSPEIPDCILTGTNLVNVVWSCKYVGPREV